MVLIYSSPWGSVKNSIVAGIVFLDGMFIWSSSPSIDKWVLDRDAVDRLRLLFRKVSTDFESPLTEMHGEDHHGPPSGPLSTAGGHLEAGQLAQGRFQSHAPAGAT